MKKFYTLLCMAAVAGSAFAFTPAQFTIDEAATKANLAKMQTAALSQELGLQEVMGTRTFTDGSGVVWNMSLLNQGYAVTDVIRFTMEDGTTATIEDIPFYFVTCQITSSEDTDFSYDLYWPTNSMYYNDDTVADALEPVSFDVLANGSDVTGKFTQFCPASGVQFYDVNDEGTAITTWGIWYYPGLECFSPFTGYYKGKEYYIGFQNGVGSTITFESFAPSTLETSTYFELMMGSKEPVAGGTNMSANVPVNYQGTMVYRGFEPMTYNYTLGDVHVFYQGEDDSDKSPSFFFEWGPLSLFYYMVGGPGVVIDYSENAGDYSFFRADESVDPSTLMFGYGHFFGEAGQTAPENGQIYTCNEVEEGLIPGFEAYGNLILWYPQAYEIVPYRSSKYNDYLGNYGSLWFIDSGTVGYSLFPGSTMQFGTTAGYVNKTVYAWEETYNMTYTGKITLHTDPSNPQVTTTIDAVGTAEPGKVQTVVENALEVMVDGRNIVAPAGSVVYDLNGRMVGTKALNAGIYVVRCGDKAVKVLVK